MTNNTRQKAITALDRMKVIVKNDMLEQGIYISDSVVDEELAKAGAVCGGHKACAIGSLWLGYGVKLQKDKDGDAMLPGTDEYVSSWYYPDRVNRHEFLKTRPALKAAYDALNSAAMAYAEKHDLVDEMDNDHSAAIEALFEGTYGEGVHRKDMLQIINNAKRSLATA